MEKVYSVDEIKKKLQPIFTAIPIEKAILFGSYSKGNPVLLSDIDIVIDSRGRIKCIDFFGVLEDIADILKTSVDLLEASQIIDGSRVQYEIEEIGIVIYERT